MEQREIIERLEAIQDAAALAVYDGDECVISEYDKGIEKLLEDLLTNNPTE